MPHVHAWYIYELSINIPSSASLELETDSHRGFFFKYVFRAAAGEKDILIFH